MSNSFAFLHLFLKIASPVCLVLMLGSMLFGYLSPGPTEPASLVWVAVAAYGTWFFWLRRTRKGVT